jgi:predicted SnoaL-like aldol condensation-catalyzing enzyme
VIELVDPNDARAVRNKDNILALYDLMINKKEAEQAVAQFFAPHYIQHNPLVPDGAAELARFFDTMAKDRAHLRIVIQLCDPPSRTNGGRAHRTSKEY